MSRTGGGPILIVDDDPLSRALMSDALEQIGCPTLGVSSASEAFEAARREPPRGIILEVCLDEVSGYEVCRELRDEFGDQLPVVFVSAQRTESHDRVVGFLVGGDDFIVKPFAVDEFVARVRRLLERAEGRPVFESALTARELEILALVADGLSRNDIAGRLYISPKTVGTHIERIYRKLGVHTRAHAVAFAYEYGMLPAASQPRTTRDA
jgi:DNA-binding NarL/FixJ family response regulator